VISCVSHKRVDAARAKHTILYVSPDLISRLLSSDRHDRCNQPLHRQKHRDSDRQIILSFLISLGLDDSCTIDCTR
jgi:hypothetical protein